MANHIDKLEKTIRSRMLGIKLGTKTPKESEIGAKLNLMKKVDEALYEELIEKYKRVLKNLEK
jgi:hypothetical protein